MEKYIPLNALVAEIKRLRDRAHELYGCSQFDTAYNNVLKSINTLEVKEVDLDEEINEHWDEWAKEDGFHFIDFAKHFFELGLNVSNPLTWEDIRLIAEIGDKFMNSEESDNLSEEDYYKEVLNRFKAQKGE